ncbi:hypothetical protein [Thalassomonas actiniarum]|uniref:Solute-binding protein family 3/N-terminal domain-containing protein n=1 Tax=Thalassomonas actiniarum TaxID=485447 RepID=A0AAE9YTB4_9GAMM|nr:hypothetical protein [Thalassomonas actiniarum]WDE00382.1 hypothetical protein SG35_007005 [Thalassomonas actiniarum]
MILPFRLFLLFCCLFNTRLPAAELLVLRHIAPESQQDTRNYYFTDLLTLALKKTEATAGPFELLSYAAPMNQSRALSSLNQDYGVDIVWTMTSNERELNYLPIRIPLLKGLLGHRIFLIHKKDRQKFANISTLEQLQALSAGQENGWPDIEILKSNGFNVVTGYQYAGLFKMLADNRFDYFPRGMNEIWQEAPIYSGLELMVEPGIVVYYPAPIYFFVAKNQPALAKRIETGLMLAIRDGSFEQLFLSHPSNQEMFIKTRLEQRKIFRLENPLLPEKTPLKNPELWYQIPREPSKD